MIFLRSKPILKITVIGCYALLFLALGISYGKEFREFFIFYSPSCHGCNEIKYKIMPEFERRFKPSLVFRYLDISDEENFKLLMSLRQKYRPNFEIAMPIFYCNGRFLSGRGINRDILLRFIENSRTPPDQPRLATTSASVDAVGYFRAFQPLAIASSGLVDGINPCAFTVILFFLSFLALQGYRKREVAVVGAAFITTVFLTYILIGVGLFNFFYHLERFLLIAELFNISIGIVSILFGALTLYDIYRFLRTKETEGFILQLPPAIKQRIYLIIGRYYRKTKEGHLQPPRLSGLVASSVIAAFLVSLLEAVCTGQLYLPTITFIIKSTPYTLQGLSYLLLYNIMFILPLILIFLMVLSGVSSAQVGNIFRRHLVAVKFLLAILFFGLGVLLIWRR